MIVAATPADYPSIMEIWESSVRATHHFLPESYLQEIKALLPSILPQVTIYVSREADGSISGFTGAAEGKMEMLFIEPGLRGRGIGSALTEYCLKELHVTKVDVNEQNEQAVGFYQHMGFRITGRRELDSLGRPYPILEMEFAPEAKE